MKAVVLVVAAAVVAYARILVARPTLLLSVVVVVVVATAAVVVVAMAMVVVVTLAEKRGRRGPPVPSRRTDGMTVVAAVAVSKRAKVGTKPSGGMRGGEGEPRAVPVPPLSRLLQRRTPGRGSDRAVAKTGRKRQGKAQLLLLLPPPLLRPRL